MARFEEAMTPTNDGVVLDLGGTPRNWTHITTEPTVFLVNLDNDHDRVGDLPNVRYVKADVTAVPFRGDSVDIAFSNSLIEHLHTLDAQRQFVSELRQSAKRLWVQTPAREFPFEPHLLAPFIHWLPPAVQRRLVPLTPWYWLYRPSPEACDEIISELRLLRKSEFADLFPDCEIIVERWLGLPKSYIAVKS